MAMVPFFEAFPDLAMRETRAAYTTGKDGIPAGHYGFLESYCDEPDCDCRRLFINVMPENSPTILATIQYGWEGAEFCRAWHRDTAGEHEIRELRKACLAPLQPQSEHALLFLKLFRTFVRDRNYVERLRRHYTMFKERVEKYPQASKEESAE
jgi:hypothetical protein